MGICVKIRDEYARVIVDGVEVEAFSLLAEDYAVSLAEQHANMLRRQIKQELNK